MNCRDWRRICDLIDVDAHVDADRLREHLAGCDDCCRAWPELAWLMSTPRVAVDTPAFRPTSRGSRTRRLLRPAMAAAALLAIAILLQRAPPPQPVPVPAHGRTLTLHATSTVERMTIIHHRGRTTTSATRWSRRPAFTFASIDEPTTTTHPR